MKMRKGYEVVAFKNKPIRIFKEGGRNGVWICLYDLCNILKRPLMMETREAMNLCPSNRRIIFKKGDKPLFAIHPYDIPKLVHLIKKESKFMESLCEELEAWAESLSSVCVKSMLAVDQGTPVTFNYQDKFPITFKTGNGKTFVNATEMAKSFGKSPAEWLRLSATTEFRQSLVSGGKSESFDKQIIAMRGVNGGTWIEECLALEFARWLSAEFSEWCNAKVHELITQGYAVIDKPQEEETVQDTTNYNPIAGNFPVPKTYAEALKLAAIQQEEIDELKGTMEENKHKVEFYEQFVENRDWFKSSTLADELQITTRALHQFLYEEKICKYENRQWVVHGYHSSLQCDVPYYWTNKDGKTNAYAKAKRWTPVGREYILELWRSKHDGGDRIQ